jgi:hypothetical protein
MNPANILLGFFLLIGMAVLIGTFVEAAARQNARIELFKLEKAAKAAREDQLRVSYAQRRNPVARIQAAIANESGELKR